MKLQALFVLLVNILLAGCATSQQGRISDAAKTPLSDLNLGQASIPALLIEAQKRPYAAPVDQSCTALLAEVRALDEVLGADLDAPPAAANPDSVERGKAMVDDTAVGLFKGAVEGLVPYRSWIRKLSGAERFSREVAAAVVAGGVRRAFLKGLRMAYGCD